MPRSVKTERNPENMRIISGKARGRRLTAPKGEEITRPTAERVKEAVFSMIQFELSDTRVLDLFGGSGQMALEALSRGAASAVICDCDRTAVAAIRTNVVNTGFGDAVRIFETDYKNLIRTFHGRESFDILFLDPPYAGKLIPDALERLDRAGMIAPGGIVICESGADRPVEYPGLALRRFARYGRVFITVLVNEVNSE